MYVFRSNIWCQCFLLKESDIANGFLSSKSAYTEDLSNVEICNSILHSSNFLSAMVNKNIFESFDSVSLPNQYYSPSSPVGGANAPQNGLSPTTKVKEE